jgi:hypothetical protein
MISSRRAAARKSQIPTQKFQGNYKKPTSKFQSSAPDAHLRLGFGLLEFPWNFWGGNSKVARLMPI